MLGAKTEFFRFFINLDFIMFGSQLGGMVVLVAVVAKMGILGDAVVLGLVGGSLLAVFA